MKHIEAKEHLCPQTFASGTPGRCHGAECAVWRWAEPQWGSNEQRKGFCGLGGSLKFDPDAAG